MMSKFGFVSQAVASATACFGDLLLKKKAEMCYNYFVCEASDK